MAVTDETPRTLDCGRTVEELSDYLAADRTPRDAHIETCPECLNALQGLERVSRLSREMLAQDVEDLPPAPETWIRGILANIQNEVRAGRPLPLSHPDPRVNLSVTEGAVRALIRSVGDEIPGLVVGRCSLNGDVEDPGAPVTVTITASVAWGRPVAALTALLREHVLEALRRHTELNVTAIDVEIQDVHVDSEEEGPR
ncbi:Asp23/Gls24 family envelope stress response protein [Microbacterium rhizomatis]|uniref:Asp23/Gls24 family envelope stress response protein n=1 Tax=Microbacterium rhizomatis TaxID=1631477 RepID=A0A5J5J0X1_9MICO|nr:Asp23/Gls24 family envelope stress response protein [Microbacterium rhizomatis]KAA9106499.1 Asp23/Gls24 family envelope stress response protein [Microbacterium rhizomatis]